MSLISCAPQNTNTTGAVVTKEQTDQFQNQSALAKAQPAPRLDWSLERDNLIKRTQRWNDPNKISYIYLLSDMGTVMAFFPIKGKVSSLGSYLTGSVAPIDDPRSYPPPSGVERCAVDNAHCYNTNLSSLLVESPDYDGSYGNNGDGVFFFLTDGTYMEWNGKYMLADQPVKLSTQPIMTLEAK